MFLCLVFDFFISVKFCHKIVDSTSRYQDQLKANVRNIPENKLIKLTGKKTNLTSLVQTWISDNLLAGKCVQKSTSFCPGGCIKFEECERTKNLSLTAFCWNLGRTCPDVNTWLEEKVSFSSRSILISGGGYEQSTVEYFSPDNSLPRCTLASLPGDRDSHTMNGLTVCGGGEDANKSANCVTLGPRGWETSHTLSQRRHYHVSWRRDSGIILMGGDFGGTDMTTEVAEDTGTVAEGTFALKYRTEYKSHKNYFPV